MIWCMTWQFHSLAIKFLIRANKAILEQAAANMHCSGIVAGRWSSRARLIALRSLEGCANKLSGAAFAPARSLLALDLS
jgi:hypothetical protein